MGKSDEVYISSSQELLKDFREAMVEVRKMLGYYVDLSSVEKYLPPPPSASWVFSSIPPRTDLKPDDGDLDDADYADDDDGYDDGYWEEINKKIEEVKAETNKLMEEMVQTEVLMAFLGRTDAPWRHYRWEMNSIMDGYHDKLIKALSIYNEKMGLPPYEPRPPGDDGRDDGVPLLFKIFLKMEQKRQELLQEEELQK
ncbi:hypothetical protein ABFS82_12G009900 [Erythranthe guttata]|uniref:Uncharacterized protein n=1 Tax=Erythranthe guttata TaxID=4155 RepID=A0A022Q7V8_ERYGU|nr:PREDICTED: uncharacterized protein LOC105972934 [Erythranthe guttata]EYU24016.1 hypothetical protein MIMGU_mgv1a014201mg [Erythranthe guttata]|eukprot:XP_012853368.1 PREDICTED: uncharacterized protein LOC105972934 [Erythranthe guttata]